MKVKKKSEPKIAGQEARDQIVTLEKYAQKLLTEVSKVDKLVQKVMTGRSIKVTCPKYNGRPYTTSGKPMFGRVFKPDQYRVDLAMNHQILFYPNTGYTQLEHLKLDQVEIL